MWGETFTKITSLSNLTTGDYVIVGQKGASDYGRLTYGTLNSSRIPYSKHYTSVPSTITTTTANEIWHIVVSGTGDTRTITIYNSGQKKYLNPGISWGNSSSNWTAAYSSGFRFKKSDDTNYLGVNKDANYWKNYASGTLYNSNTYCLTLYKAPSCSSWSDPTVTYSATTLTAGGAHATVSISGTTYGTSTFSSSDDDILTVNSTTGEVTPVSNGNASVTVSWAGNATYCSKDVVIDFTVNKAAATIKLSEAGAESTVSGTHYSGDSYTLPSSTEATCGTKVLVGWSTVEVAETDTKPTSNFYEKGETVTLKASQTFYAVFATASGGTTTWTLTALDAVTAGTYAIVNQSNYAFMGTITDGHGNVTNNAFEFTDGVATSAPDGTCEVIFEIQSDGFSMYNTSSKKYLYASKAASGGLAEQESKPADYWNYYKTNWQYHYNYSGKYARLRSASSTPGGLRIYGDDSGNGVVKLAKKSGGTTYSAYTTSCEACGVNADMSSAVASLNSPFTTSSVGVTVTGCAVGTNCSWTDYGFVWGTSANPTVSNNIVRVGTSGSATTWVGTLTGSFTTGMTYHYRAYGKNGYASGTYQYSSDQTFTPLSVTFNLNGHGSSTPSTQIVNNGSKATDPSYSESVTGWRFDGWYANSSCTGSAWDFSTNTVSGDNVTLYAKWTQVYTVTYNYNGGTSSCADANKYAAGTTVTVCSTPPTKAGSTFQGWLGDNNIGTKAAGSTFTMPAADVTLTAQWTDTKYTLTQTTGSHTTKGHTGTVITSGMTSSSGLDLTYTISDNSYALPKTVTISGGGQTWTLGTNYTWELSPDKHSATLHIGNDLTISDHVIVTIQEQTRYTVVWDEHGNTTTDYYAADDNDVTMKSGIADCGEKKFYGWTEDAEFVSDPTTPPTMASSGAISGNKHYYAIFGDKSGGDGFVLVTSITAGEGYYMATGLTSSDKVYTGQNASNEYGGCTANSSLGSSFSGETLLAFPANAKSLTVAISNGNFSLYDGTSYLGAANSNSLTFNDAPVYEWKLSDNKIQSQSYKSRYIKRNTNNERVCAYETTSGVADMYLYKSNISWTNFAKTCTLYDIEITTPSGGEVTTTPSAGTGVAGEGQTVTVNVTPNSCKYLSALKYNDGSDHAISIASTPYTFTMPASNVTVTATFADKTVSRIDPVTSTYRALMQNTSFEGEQIRVTYNNGETEDLAWDNASLTFSGYTMSTLGEQTVSVAYSGSCGSANTSYSIEITDGIPVTFSDCGITTVRKYGLGDVVPVETTAGEYACSGWEFVGWSESSVAANSTSFTPVRNFNASTARTLYAVYANVGTDWISAFNTSELRGGATYVIVYRGYSYDYALLNTVASTNYLNGQQLATACSTITEPGSPTKDRYVLKVTPTAAMKWQIVPNGDYYSLYNAATNKYLKITTDQHALLTSSCEDKFTIANGYNDSQLSLKSFNASASNYYLYWYNSGTYFEGWTTAQGLFLLTNVETFSSTPPCAPQAAIFHGNGGTVIASGGSPTGGDLTIREATRDAGITTPIAEYEDCDGKSWSFIGWADHEVDVTRVPILTTELLNDGGGNKPHTITRDDEEFWAIYTNQGEALTKYGTISFSMSDFSGNYLSEEHTVTKVVSGDNYVFGDKRIGHASETGIQFEAVNGEFYNKTSLGKINSISFGSFAAGVLSNLRVYVGNSEKATTYELTAAELQVVGGVSTYYPTHDCEYVYIKSGGTYACVTSISIDFGKGTQVWATTPDCKRVTLSGDIYATSTNGRGIMAVTPLRVNAFQLDPSAGIVISSNSSDVYFSTDRNANFAKAAANQPKNSVTINAGLDGNLSTDVYVHYKPSSAGDGVPADVNVYANLAVQDPSVTASHSIHVRNMPEKFVVAAKVGATWYALPADMNAETNPSGVVIEVDETNMTATAPNTCSYTIWPVKTTNGEYDRYAINTAHYDGNAFGERVRFSAVNNSNKGLWANNATSGNGIRNYAAITSASDGGTTENTNPAYEWKITTTIVDGK